MGTGTGGESGGGVRARKRPLQPGGEQGPKDGNSLENKTGRRYFSMKSATTATENEEQQRFVLVPMPENWGELSSTARLAWFALCSFTWRQNWNDRFRRGRCWPSIRKLAKEMGTTTKTTQAALVELQYKGLLLIQKQGGESRGGKILANRYTLFPGGDSQQFSVVNNTTLNDVSNFSVGVTTTPSVVASTTLSVVATTTEEYKYKDKEKHKKGGAPAPKDLTNSDLQGPHNPEPIAPPEEEETIIPDNGKDTEEASTSQEEKAPVTANEVDALFNSVWQSYSTYNYQGKAEARRQFHKMLDGKPYNEAKNIIQDISHGLEDAEPRWIDSGEVNKKFVPTLANWLRRNYD